MSLVCEAFQCLPHEAVRAIENDPGHLIPRILAVRSFTAAWHSYKKDGMKFADENPMIFTVRDIEFDEAEGIGEGEEEGDD